MGVISSTEIPAAQWVFAAYFWKHSRVHMAAVLIRLLQPRVFSHAFVVFCARCDDVARSTARFCRTRWPRNQSRNL